MSNWGQKLDEDDHSAARDIVYRLRCEGDIKPLMYDRISRMIDRSAKYEAVVEDLKNEKLYRADDCRMLAESRKTIDALMSEQSAADFNDDARIDSESIKDQPSLELNLANLEWVKSGAHNKDLADALTELFNAQGSLSPAGKDLVSAMELCLGVRMDRIANALETLVDCFKGDK